MCSRARCLLTLLVLLACPGLAWAERGLGLRFSVPAGYRVLDTGVALDFEPTTPGTSTLITLHPPEPAQGDLRGYFDRKLAEEGGREVRSSKVTDQRESHLRGISVVQAFRDNLRREHYRFFAALETRGQRLTTSMVAPDQKAFQQALPALQHILDSLEVEEPAAVAGSRPGPAAPASGGLDGVFVNQELGSRYNGASNTIYSVLSYYFWVFWPDGRFSMGLCPTGQHFDFAKIPANERHKYGTYQVVGRQLILHRLDGQTDSLPFQRSPDGFVLKGSEYRRLVPLGTQHLQGTFHGSSG